MGLEEEIKIVSDFLDRHESINERHNIYCQMRDDIMKNYYINEVDILGKVLKYRKDNQTKSPLVDVYV